MGVSARKDTAFSGFCKDFFDFLIFAQSSGISGQSRVKSLSVVRKIGVSVLNFVKELITFALCFLIKE